MSYRVTWTVAGKLWRKTFETKSQANAYRASLLTATSNGEAFLVSTGLPLSAAPRPSDLTWYEFTLDYTTMKWPTLSPGSRRGVAEALTDATEALMTRHRPPVARGPARRAALGLQHPDPGRPRATRPAPTGDRLAEPATPSGWMRSRNLPPAVGSSGTC